MDKVKKTLIIIAIYAVMGFVLMIFVFGYFDDLGKQEAIEKQEKATATITSLEPHIQDGIKDTWYNVIYEYYSDDGVHYWGIIPIMTDDHDYALSLMGEKVEILIDGQGHCLRVSEIKDFDKKYNRNMCIIVGTIIAAYTVIWITLIVRERLFNKKIHNRKKEAIKDLISALNHVAEIKRDSVEES